MKILPIVLVLLLFAVMAVSVVVTRDGALVTPQGEGTVVLDAGTFEAFPLPDYAARFLHSRYKSYLVEVEPGIKVHVLDVGSGFPVFLQHGNPTSGFLYRKIAQELRQQPLRLIMPTLVGLGFSSKVPASEHTLENHIRWINGVLAQLQIRELVYVGQDWGGPIGMGALARSPTLLRGAVVMNTGFSAPTEPMDLSTAHAVVKTPVVGELLLGHLFPVFGQLPRLQGDPASIPEDVVDLYARPVDESGNRKAPVALMRMVADGPDHPSVPAMRVVEGYVQTLNIPVEILWGMNDPILGKALPAMKQHFPAAPVIETQGGHFLQEEAAAEIAAAITRVVARVGNAP